MFLKEIIVPTNANLFLFFLAPVFTLFSSVLLWLVIPFNKFVVLLNVPYSMLFLLAVSSLAVYGIIFSGWASNSKYSFLGGLRSSAQMISYEVCISFVWLIICLLSESLNLADVVRKQEEAIWYIFPLFPLWIVFFIIVLAETNRAPFDSPEAEAELVAGYNVEYSSIAFALFFLGEYANMALMSALCTIFFWGGWLSPFSLISMPYFWFGFKTTLHLVGFVWVRATLPRYRYDQLMKLGWKKLMPATIVALLVCVFCMLLVKYYAVASNVWEDYFYLRLLYVVTIVIVAFKAPVPSFLNFEKEEVVEKNYINTKYILHYSKKDKFKKESQFRDYSINMGNVNSYEYTNIINKQLNKKNSFFFDINLNDFLEQIELEKNKKNALKCSYIVNKLVSLCTKKGKKKKAYKVVYSALFLLKSFFKINPIYFIKQSVLQIKPFVFLQKITKGKKVFIFPRILPLKIRVNNALNIIVKNAFAMKKQYRYLSLSLAYVILENGVFMLADSTYSKKVKEDIEIAELNKKNIKYKKKGKYVFSKIRKKERFKLFKKVKAWK